MPLSSLKSVGPVINTKPFDFEKMKEKGVHNHEVLKQREG